MGAVFLILPRFQGVLLAPMYVCVATETIQAGRKRGRRAREYIVEYIHIYGSCTLGLSGGEGLEEEDEELGGGGGGASCCAARVLHHVDCLGICPPQPIGDILCARLPMACLSKTALPLYVSMHVDHVCSVD